MKKIIEVSFFSLTFLSSFLASLQAQDALPKVIEKAPAVLAEKSTTLFNG